MMGTIYTAHSGLGKLHYKALLMTLFVSALSTVPVLATTSISQGYISKDAVTVGSLVSLVSDSADTVEAATSDTTNSLLGVVVSGQSSSLAFGNGTSGEVQVATGGSVNVLVSDINGSITQGSQITASPIAGIGMAVSANSKVIGTAQADMTVTTQQTIDDNGTQKTVNLGSVPVLINVSYHYQTPDKTLIPVSIQNLANALAGKEVKPLPIILSGIIFIVMLIVVMIIIFSMIRSSIISVGRNPLAQSAVYRDVIQLSAVVIAVVAASIVAIYLILRTL